jgi:hypothetical protein
MLGVASFVFFKALAFAAFTALAFEAVAFIALVFETVGFIAETHEGIHLPANGLYMRKQCFCLCNLLMGLAIV